MPRFDGTGPNGQGPMTGRGMGQCNNAHPADNENTINEANHPTTQPLNQGFGRGYGRQAGFGRGMGRRGGGFGRGFGLQAGFGRGMGRQGGGFGQGLCDGSRKRIRGCW